MKGGLCIIYTSLLTISVLSSCALFLLVVSEVQQAEVVEGPAVDSSGFHNVSHLSAVKDGALGPGLPSEEFPEPQDGPPEEPLLPNELIFAESLSLNSVTTDGLPDTGQPPILISLADNAKLDLKAADELLYANDSEQHNDTKTFIIVDGKGNGETDAKAAEKEQETLVVKAKPMHETRQVEDAFQTTPTPPTEVESTESQPESEVTETTDVPPKPETPQEDIPSFSEWAQKQLAEAEKKDTVLNHSTQPSHSNTNFSSKNAKVRSKNYASPACGAKIVAVNPEAGSASSILSPNRDEYMLNTCNSRIWFVVELCEAVQAQKIELANFELFSSTPKEFAVYFSDRFPTRDWASVGQFTAKDMRDVQSFDLFPHLFGKFIKVEMLSHHGSEHYCPVSLFKVYGTSEFEVLEKESSQHAAHNDEDEDDDIIDLPNIPTVESEASKNLFGSARDAVMSIMKKAAQVLVKTEAPKNVSSVHNDTSTDKLVYKSCCSPSHIIVCDNCSEALYNDVYDLISCDSDKLTNLVRQVFLYETLKCTNICNQYGLDFKSTKTVEFREERVAYMNALFPSKYLAALCNILAIKEKKVVLNSSFETENVTVNITDYDVPSNVNNEAYADKDVKLVPPKDNVSSEDDNKTNESVEFDIKPLVPDETDDETTSEEELPGTEIIDEKKEESTTVVDDKPVPEKPESEEAKPVPETEKPTEAPKAETDAKETTPKVEITIEKPKESPSSTGGDEVNEQILIENDSFLSDLDQLTVDPTPPGMLPSQSNQNPSQTIQKESVFLRLSNRVKTLERNMSLSAQYLEELSRRYKKQVEEMQKSFEKTVLQMTEERRKSNDREQKYLDQRTTLQDQISHMATAMNILMEERESWFGNITFFKFLVLQSVIVAGVVYYIRKRRRAEPIILPVPRKVKKSKEKLRRKSVEGVSGHATPAVKKRRPSEEALAIARQSTEETEREDLDGEWQVARKNRRRKSSILHRHMEHGEKHTWGRQDSIGMLRENPIPLDEEEFMAPVSEPKEFLEILPLEPKKEAAKTNGSLFNNLKSKTLKTRRLSSPAFLRTFSRQSSRSTGTVARTLEPIFNGKDKKAMSESPTSSLWSESTEISQVNGFDESTRQKKKKGLKNIFKKVF